MVRRRTIRRGDARPSAGGPAKWERRQSPKTTSCAALAELPDARAASGPIRPALAEPAETSSVTL